MVHDTPKLFREGKTLDDKMKFRISGLVGLIGTFSAVASSFLNNKSLKYSFMVLSLVVAGTGLFGMYKTMGYNNKIKLINFCEKFSKYIGNYFI